MSHDSEMSTDPADEDLQMYISPDDPSTSAHSTFQEQRYDKIVGRELRKNKVYYEILPAVQFGFSSSIFEDPAMLAPYNIAKFEYDYHNRSESIFPIPGTDPDTQPLSIRWFGKLDHQRYFLIEYDNQTHRLIEMNDSSNSLDPVTRQFVCDNLECYLKASKIDMHGDDWPTDPVNFDPNHCQPGPSSSFMRQQQPMNKEKVCTCSISRFFQRAKPKLCPSKLESLIRRKKSPKNRKKGHQMGSSDEEEEPPKKCGRQM